MYLCVAEPMETIVGTKLWQQENMWGKHCPPSAVGVPALPFKKYVAFTRHDQNPPDTCSRQVPESVCILAIGKAELIYFK